MFAEFDRSSYRVYSGCGLSHGGRGLPLIVGGVFIELGGGLQNTAWTGWNGSRLWNDNSHF